MSPRQGIILALVAALVAGFFIFDLDRLLTFEYIKSSQARLDAFYASNHILVAFAYAAVYISVTALSLPGAVVMTLAGGAIFGLLWGTVIVSFSSTIGATLACAIARFALRDAVQGRFGNRLAAINRGIEREGAFYLFTLRLIPVVPFFVINLAMGLTTMPLGSR